MEALSLGLPSPGRKVPEGKTEMSVADLLALLLVASILPLWFG